MELAQLENENCVCGPGFLLAAKLPGRRKLLGWFLALTTESPGKDNII